jgi:glycerol kinase
LVKKKNQKIFFKKKNYTKIRLIENVPQIAIDLKNDLVLFGTIDSWVVWVSLIVYFD